MGGPIPSASARAPSLVHFPQKGADNNGDGRTKDAEEEEKTEIMKGSFVRHVVDPRMAAFVGSFVPLDEGRTFDAWIIGWRTRDVSVYSVV